MNSYNIISADSHINEPPDLFEGASRSLRDVMPKLIHTEKGDAWVMGPGAEPRLISSSAVAGRKKEEYLATPVTYETMRPGSFDPGARLKDMDLDHIDADVMYPGILRWLERGANPEARLACARIYNEWMASFCAHDSSRLVGVAVLPILEDQEGNSAIEALREAHRLGLRAAFLSQKDGGLPLHHPTGERFWSVAEELDIPVSIHIHTNPFTRGMNPEYMKLPGSREMFAATIPVAMAEHMSTLIFGGVFMRHPKLKIVFAEGGTGWMPGVLERLDQVFNIHRIYMGSKITELPSETFKRQCYATFGEDRIGLKLRDEFGADSLMWASDYPHTDTTWPESKKVIESAFADVPRDITRKIVCDNAAKLYGITRTQSAVH